MGKRGAKWKLLALQVASVQKILSRLALSNKRFGKTLQLSLLLTKALVARSPATAAGLTKTTAAARSSRNSNNTKSTPQGALLLHLIRPCLDLAPWIYSLVFLTRLPFFPIPTLTHAMASIASSTAFSSPDISTPRSISPSSVVSARSSQSSITATQHLSTSSPRRITASHPMSPVDIAATEETMRMANLDTLRGYAQNHYGEVQQPATTEYLDHTDAFGYQVLNEPMWNKGESIQTFLPRPPSVTPSSSFFDMVPPFSWPVGIPPSPVSNSAGPEPAGFKALASPP